MQPILLWSIELLAQAKVSQNAVTVCANQDIFWLKITEDFGRRSDKPADSSIKRTNKSKEAHR